jgi:adenine-specific DNA-methyltransferase
VSKKDADFTKLDMQSEDIAKARRQELLRIFPEAHTESGRINFEALRLSLGDAVETGPEGFGMSWPGKAECAKTIQRQSVATLLPVEEESVNWDTTQNVIIEGDNLEVLKVLQKAYLGKVKMIYIDPPYNTGNDFIYPDNYAESLKTYLQYTGQVDDEGRKFSTNTESSGRFHSKWMNMMYPRLSLARNLMREDGVIFVSIDDNELNHLVVMMNDIFGEDCIETYIWDVREAGQIPKTPKSTVRKEHEYLVAAWRTSAGKRFSKYKDQPYLNNEKWTNADSDPRGAWMSGNLSRSEDSQGSGSNFFEIVTPSGKSWKRTWTVGQEEFNRLNNEGRIYFADGGNGVPRRKIFKTDTLEVTQSSIFQSLGSSQSGRRSIEDLTGLTFPYPKPMELVARMCALSTEDDDIVLDFFAGSGTTGHAVIAQNLADGLNRRFVLVQLPELLEESENPKIKTIADVARMRLDRVIAKYIETNGELFNDEDSTLFTGLGFRSFLLAESNFAVWDANAIEGDETKLEQQLFAQVEHVLPGRTNQDILFELMLKSRYELTTSVEQVKVGKCEVWKVAGGELVAIIDSGLTIEVIREIAGWNPTSVVILDRCFGADDSLKANARKIFEDSKVDLKTV